MAFPATMHIWIPFEIPTAAQLNSDLRDATSFLKGLSGQAKVEDSLFVQSQAGATTVNIIGSGLTATTTQIRLVHSLRNGLGTARDALLLDTSWADATDGSEDSQTDIWHYVAGSQAIVASQRAGLVIGDGGGDPTGGDLGRGYLNVIGIRAETLRAFAPTIATQVASVETAASATADDIAVTVTQYDVLTTDGSATEIAAIPTNTDETTTVEFQVIGRRTGGISGTGAVGDGAQYHGFATFKNVGGTVTQIGTDTFLAVHESLATYNLSVGVTGADIDIEVTGAFQQDLSWHATIRVYRIGT